MIALPGRRAEPARVETPVVAESEPAAHVAAQPPQAGVTSIMELAPAVLEALAPPPREAEADRAGPTAALELPALPDDVLADAERAARARMDTAALETSAGDSRRDFHPPEATPESYFVPRPPAENAAHPSLARDAAEVEPSLDGASAGALFGAPGSLLGEEEVDVVAAAESGVAVDDMVFDLADPPPTVVAADNVDIVQIDGMGDFLDVLGPVPAAASDEAASPRVPRMPTWPPQAGASREARHGDQGTGEARPSGDGGAAGGTSGVAGGTSGIAGGTSGIEERSDVAATSDEPSSAHTPTRQTFMGASAEAAPAERGPPGQRPAAPSSFEVRPSTEPFLPAWVTAGPIVRDPAPRSPRLEPLPPSGFAPPTVGNGPTLAASGLLGNEALDDEPVLALDNPVETLFDDMAFQVAEVPSPTTPHEPDRWEVEDNAGLKVSAPEPDLPVVVGADLPGTLGKPREPGDTDPLDWFMAETGKKS